MSIFDAGSSASGERLQQSLADDQLAAITEQLESIYTELHEWIEEQRALRDRLFALDDEQARSAGGPSEDMEPGQFMPVLPRTGDVVMTHQRGHVPPGWLLCDGTEKSAHEYANLFRVIGYLYGRTSVPDQFRLPTLTDIRHFEPVELAAWLESGDRGYIIRT